MIRRASLLIGSKAGTSPPPSPVTGYMPMSPVPSYNLNAGGDYPTGTGVNMFFNGQLNQTVVVGYGKVNPVDVYIFPLYTLYDSVTISEVEFYHHTGTGSPTMVYGLLNYNDTPVLLASYGGSPTPDIGWIPFTGFSPQVFKYIKIVAGNYKPAQMRFTATYTPKVAPTLYPVQLPPFSQMCGVNMFEWNYLDDFGNHRAVLPSSRAAMKTFSQLRHYLDWDKLEHVQGQYTFSPSSPGGWDYDVMYTDMKANGFYVMACIKQQPNWMESAYPSNMQNGENAPVKYVSGAQADKSLPVSYTDYGKVLFQYVARYGSNTTIDPSLVTPHTVGPDNTKNRIKYCTGGRDK
jgi:endoglucanase